MYQDEPLNITVAPLAVSELCSSKQFIHKVSNTLEISLLGASATTRIFSNCLSISHKAGRRKKQTPSLEMNRLTALTGNST